MTRVLAAACVLAALYAASPATPAAPQPVSVSVDRMHVATTLGRNFSFATRIVNEGTRPTPALVAHLNVLSLYPGVYVDPEDWSSNRTRYLDPIPPHGARRLAWTVKAVNSGEIAVYVTVLPQSGPAVPPSSSPAIRASIAKQRTLNAGGIVPLAAGVPALLALLAVGVRAQRRRR